ncbi:hypothetical protein ET418_10595, partial [Oryzomonas rubra]
MRRIDTKALSDRKSSRRHCVVKHVEADSYWGGIIKSMGLVFGDIGTSPIYTLTVIIALTKPTQENVF